MAKAKTAKIEESKKLKFNDLIKLDAKTLDSKIQELLNEVAELKRNTITGDVQNVRAFINKRRELARVLTAKHQLHKEEK